MDITGSGFSSNSQITICNKQCKVLRNSLSTLSCQVINQFLIIFYVFIQAENIFKVPEADNKNSDSICQLVLLENGLSATKSFTYKASLTPTLTSVLPLRGGTGGGTLITISGSNFPYIDY